MTRQLVFAAAALSMTACAPTASPYRFKNEAQRACFRPCRVHHAVCIKRCDERRGVARSGLHAAVNAVGGGACHGGCRTQTERCARECSSGGGRGKVRPPSAAERERDLHLQRMETEGKLALLDKRCRELDKSLRASAGLGRSSCPPLPVVMRSCRLLTPEAVGCLAPDLSAAAEKACGDLLRAENRRAVHKVFELIVTCTGKRHPLHPPVR